jgi:hypothetical protein
MGILSNLLGGGVIEGAKGIAEIVDKFVETPEEKEAAKIVFHKLQQRPDEVQAEINKIEAGHRSLFVAGWRPAIGWICATALGWGWIVAPVLQFFFPENEMPAIELGQAISLVMALLGMGALRTYEKQNKLSK